MPKRGAFPAGTATRCREFMKKATSREEFLRWQSVSLVEDGHTNEEIARITGLKVTTVRALHARCRHEGVEALADQPEGGRNRFHLTVEEEGKVLERFFVPAQHGQVLIAKQVQEEISRAAGRPVTLSGIYKLLHRHGWRKLAPRPRHPRADPEAQEAFKKTPDHPR